MGRRQDNKQRKLDRLQREGLRLFLARGYTATSIEQIAAASEIARGTYYLYFPDKHALFDALMQRWDSAIFGILDDVEQLLMSAQTPAECLKIYEDMALGLALIGVSCHEEILLAFREVRGQSEAGTSLRDRELRLLDKVELLTRIGADRGLIRAPHPRVVGLVITGAVERLYYEMLMVQTLDIDPDQVAREVVRLFALALQIPLSQLQEGPGGLDPHR